MSWRILGRLVVVAAIVAFPVVGYAQEATVSGTVTDSTGGVLPGVVVRAVHEASGNSFEAVTDGGGNYRLVVRIGAYRISAELAGFAPLTRTGLELLVGQQAVVNLEMRAASLEESVTVTGEAAERVERCTDAAPRVRADQCRRPANYNQLYRSW